MKKDNSDLIEVLRLQLEEAQEIHDKAFNSLPPGLDFDGLEKAMAVTGDKLAEISRQYRLVKPYKLSKSTIKKDDGDVMSIKEFISCCKSGGFIDYDGYGKYVKDGRETDITILASDVKHNSVRKDFKEIIWFNR